MVPRINLVENRKFWGCSRFPKCRGTQAIKKKRKRGYREKFELFHGKKIESGHDIHHIDGDPSNDDPDNFMEIESMSHRELTAAIKRWKTTAKRGTKIFNEIQIMEKRLNKNA